MHCEGVRFLLFPLCSHKVPIKISSSSQCVPQHIPHCSSLFPKFFAQNSTLENLYLYIQPKQRDYNIFILGLSKAFVMGKSKMPII
jgi:hypothetical protein